jgi:GAF domain-containing protein
VGEPKRALALAIEHFAADTGTLHRLGPDGVLHLEAHAGNIPDSLLPVIQTIPVGKGIAGLAVERKAPVDICNLQTDSSGDARPRAKETGVQGSICVPLMRGDEAVGALGIATVRERIFTEAEIEELMALGRALAEA